MPETIYGYCRVSTETQVQSGLSLAEQQHQVTAYADAIAARNGAKVGKVYIDKAISGSKTTFRRRPQAGKLFVKVNRGDHIVIAKLDRGFRSTKDCLATLDDLGKRGVTVHLLDIGIDTSQPSGKLLVTIMAAIAQWESDRIGDRIRDALAARRRSAPNKAVSAVRVIGYAIDEDHLLTPHAEERAAGKLAARLRSEGLAYDAIAAQLNKAGLIRPGNPYGPKSQRADREWTASSVATLVKRQRQAWPMYPGTAD